MFDLKVGFSCNNNCIHCVVNDKKTTKDLTFEEICSIIDTVPFDEPIQFTGGEISIRKDFYEILKYSSEKGHENHVQTNGTGFSDLELARKCAPLLSDVLLAIHSCKEEIHNRIIRSKQEQKSMFIQTVEGFKNLISCNVYVETQTVLSTLNIDTLYETYDFIQKIKPGTLMHLTYPHMMGSAYENREKICFPYSKYSQILRNCFRDFGKYLLVEAVPPCYIFPYYNAIEYHFEAEIKKNHTNRNGYDPSQNRHIDYDVEDAKDKRKAAYCTQCFYNEECFGVWKEYTDLYKESLDLTPINSTCVESVDQNFIELTSKINPQNLKKVIEEDAQYVIYGEIEQNTKELQEINSPNFIVDITQNSELINNFNFIHSLLKSEMISSLRNLSEETKCWITLILTDKSSLLEIIKNLMELSSIKNIVSLRVLVGERKISKKLKEIIYEISEYAITSNLNILFENIPKCYLFSFNNKTIDKLKATLLRLPNLKEEVFELKTFKTDKCKNCTENTKCFGFNETFTC